MRVRPAIALISFCLTSCQRADPVGSVEPARTPPSAPVTAAPSQVEAVHSCVVPMVEPGPPTAAPAKHCPVAPTVALPLRHGTLKFLGGQQPTIDVELALTAEDQQRGLMYRTELGAESGMLFSWSNETLHAFWMHNTCLPLDMLFIAADGTITGILEQVPVLNDEPRSIPCPTAHVLEVNAGYCRKHGVAPGQRVRIKAS